MSKPKLDAATLDGRPPEALTEAVRLWAEEQAEDDGSLLKVGYVGTFSVEGSEEETHVDVVLVLEDTDIPPAERVDHWDLADIPYPTQPLVYTAGEWEAMQVEGGWLARKLESDAVWVWTRD